MKQTDGKAGGMPPEDWRTRRFPPWIIAFALGLHGLLLLIPLVNDLPTPVESTLIEISLIEEPAEPDLPEPPLEYPDEFVREVVTPPPEPARVVIGAQPPPEVAVEPSEPAATEPTPTLTVARLLDSVSDLDWKESPSAEQQIARATDSELYDELTRPVMAMTVNWFDDMVLPDDVEVMDRWLEPGGVHKVVVRTPGGMTLCGRQEAPNDLRPWEQMPMMFGKCAGGWRKARPSKTWRDSP